MALILLAEDDPDLRSLLAARLRRCGHTVSTVTNGAEALTAIKQCRFHLVLLDLAIPRVDALTLARRAADIDPRVRVMFIAGFSAIPVSKAGDLGEIPQIWSRAFHLQELPDQVETLLAA